MNDGLNWFDRNGLALNRSHWRRFAAWTYEHLVLSTLLLTLLFPVGNIVGGIAFIQERKRRLALHEKRLALEEVKPDPSA